MMPGATEIIIIAIVVILLFGGKKLPELAKGLAQSLQVFKRATKDIKDEVDSATKEVDELKKDIKD